MLHKLTAKVKGASYSFVRNKLPKYCHRSRLLSSIYYGVFDKSFAREHQAVLAGRIKHVEEASQEKGNYFLMVRNTHRLEKGLLMRPRRAVFAKEYIGETMDNFESIWNHKEISGNPQMKWFYDVLSSYFESAGTDPDIEKYQERFKKKVNGFDTAMARADTPVKAVPYHRLQEQSSHITFEEFYKLTRQRRSVRWFDARPVPRELIDKAVLAANQSPSACNRQPYEFRIFDDPALVQEVTKYPMGTSGYGHNIPVMIVLVGNLDAYFDERDRHVIYIDASLAAMSFMLALETMGLSSCSINWPDVEEKEVKMEKFLKLKTQQRALMCMAVGYSDPEGMVAFSEKRPLDQIRQYN